MFCQKDFINLAIGFILPWTRHVICFVRVLFIRLLVYCGKWCTTQAWCILRISSKCKFNLQVQNVFLKRCEFAGGGCGLCFLLPESVSTFCQPVKCFHPLQQSDGAVRELQRRPHGNKSWAGGKLWTKRLTLKGHSFKHTSLRPPPPVCDTRVNCVHHSYHSYFHRAELCHRDFTAVWTKP